MMTQLRASPCTSTPCQKLEVPKRTALGVARNSSSRALRGRGAVEKDGKIEDGQQALVEGAHLAVAGEEAEGAAAGDGEDAVDAVGGGFGKVGIAGVGHVGRQIEQGLLAVAEVGRDDELAGFGEAETAAHVLEAALHGERGRGEDDGGDGFEDQLAEQLGDIDGRGLEEGGAARCYRVRASPCGRRLRVRECGSVGEGGAALEPEDHVAAALDSSRNSRSERRRATRFRRPGASSTPVRRSISASRSLSVARTAR